MSNLDFVIFVFSVISKNLHVVSELYTKILADIYGMG